MTLGMPMKGITMKTIKKKCKDIIWLCRPYWKYGKLYLMLSVVVFALCAVLDNVIYVRSPEVIINLLADGRAFRDIAVIVIIIQAVSYFKSIFSQFFSRYFAKKKEEMELKLKRDIYEKAVATDYEYVDTPEYYDTYAWAVNEYAGQTDAARDFLVNIFRYFASIAVLASMIAAIGPWLLLAEVLQLLFRFMIVGKLDQNDIWEKDELIPVDRRLNYYHRLFYRKDYAADLKTTSLKNLISEKYRKAGKQRADLRAHHDGIEAFWLVMFDVVFLLAEGAIILGLIYSILSGKIPEIGMYVTMLLGFYRLDSYLEELIEMLEQANELSLNARRIRRFFDIESKIETGDFGECAAPEGRFAVELRDAGFAYEKSCFSLSHLNLTIRPGEKVAIVGENGVGKSTLVKLLLRLYDVQEGEILIDGRPIREYDLHQLRQRIGVAFQDTNIYAMSFRENVSLYGQVTEHEMDELSERLGFGAVLEKNRGGYDTELTREFQEDGMMLSGGEAQKVALARVMCGEFGLLLLDEPSSALDPIAEYKMNKMILDAAGGTTAIIVSHRLSTVRDADRIVLLEGGRVKESGTHDELMALKGKYFEMFTLQAENYVN